MTKYCWLLILGLLLSVSVCSQPALDLYPFESKTQMAQFQHLLKSLRCLVCQNQNLEDSHAPLAKDLKQKVYALVQEGHSDDEIMRYMTDRYGDFVLFNPPVKWVTYLLWLGPLLFLLVGFLIFLRTCNQKKA